MFFKKSLLLIMAVFSVSTLSQAAPTTFEGATANESESRVGAQNFSSLQALYYTNVGLPLDFHAIEGVTQLTCYSQIGKESQPSFFVAFNDIFVMISEPKTQYSCADVKQLKKEVEANSSYLTPYVKLADNSFETTYYEAAANLAARYSVKNVDGFGLIYLFSDYYHSPLAYCMFEKTLPNPNTCVSIEAENSAASSSFAISSEKIE